MEAAGRKCPTSGVHRTGCCIVATRHATRIHSVFRCLTKKRLWWYLASASPSQSSWLILVHKNRNIVKGMNIQGYLEDKAQSQAALEHVTKQEFQRCFQLWERHWVVCLNHKGDPFE